VVTELLQLLQPNGEVVAEDGAETILAEAKAEQAEAACTAEAAEELDAESTLPQPTSAALTEALAAVMLTQAV
jgi:type II secretory pathway component PulM